MESTEKTHHSDDDKGDKAVEESPDPAETSGMDSVPDNVKFDGQNLDMEPAEGADADGVDSDNGDGNGDDNDNDDTSNSALVEKNEAGAETTVDHEGTVAEQERESSPVPSGVHDTMISNQESMETHWEDAKFDHEESLVTAQQLINGTGVGDGEDEFSFEVRGDSAMGEDRKVMDVTPVPPLEAVKSTEQEEEANEKGEEGQEVGRDFKDEDSISNTDDVATVRDEAPAENKSVEEASPVAGEQIESGGSVHSNDVNKNHEDAAENTSEKQVIPSDRNGFEDQEVLSEEISEVVKNSKEETTDGTSSKQLDAPIVEQEDVFAAAPHTPDSQGSTSYFVQAEEVARKEIGSETQEEQELEGDKLADSTPQILSRVRSRPPPPDMPVVPPRNLPENATTPVSEDQAVADDAASPPLPPRSPRSPRSPKSPRSPRFQPTEGLPEDVKIDDMVTEQPKRVHNVPPPLSEEMKNPNFRKNFTSLRTPTISSPRSPKIDSAADINLIVNRFLATSQQVDHETVSTRQNITEGQYLLKENYTNILESGQGETEVEPGKVFVPVSPALKNPEIVVSGPEGVTKVEGIEEEDDEEIKVLSNINWAFWTSVVNDFGTVAQQNADQLEKEISKGIPSQIRGIIWQLIANSKSKEFEDIYYTLLDTPSPHEMSIRRDLQRTNFIPKERFDSLFNVMKVYSIYDPDVGYTQGMGFITTPLLLNCENEADALGLLIVLMKNYNLRDLFLSEMPGLMLLLYQFDRLLEENSPMLYNHLSREGIRSSMYATQWFLTFFAYKFPLGFVLRIFDIVFFEGIESILKFAVNLMLKNKDTILNLKFDQLLNFLKNDLFEFYSVESIEKRKSGTSGKHEVNNSSSGTKNFNRVNHDIKHISTEYNIDLFVSDAMNDVHITPISLHRYSAEYREISELRHQREIEYELVRIKNHQLKKESMKLRHNYNLLNKEHIVIANELIEVRLKLETLLDENHDLKSTVTQLGKQIQEEHEKAELPNPDAKLQSNLRLDLRRTRERAAEVMDENRMLHRKIRDLKILIKELREENEAKVVARYPIYQTSESAGNRRVSSHGSVGDIKENNNYYDNYGGDITGSHLDVPRRASGGRRLSSGSTGGSVAAAFNKGWSGFKKAFKKDGS